MLKMCLINKSLKITKNITNVYQTTLIDEFFKKDKKSYKLTFFSVIFNYFFYQMTLIDEFLKC